MGAISGDGGPPRSAGQKEREFPGGHGQGLSLGTCSLASWGFLVSEKPLPLGWGEWVLAALLGERMSQAGIWRCLENPLGKA